MAIDLRKGDPGSPSGFIRLMAPSEPAVRRAVCGESETPRVGGTGLILPPVLADAVSALSSSSGGGGSDEILAGAGGGCFDMMAAAVARDRLLVYAECALVCECVHVCACVFLC
jgi:hypothetical protein